MAKFHRGRAERLQAAMGELVAAMNEHAQDERDCYDSHSEAWLDGPKAPAWDAYTAQMEEAAELLNQALDAMDEGLAAIGGA